MKVLFLDVDGVLNCAHSGDKASISNRLGFIGIEPGKVEMVNRITRDTGAKIVISSTWRTHSNSYAAVCESGLEAEILGATPVHKDSRRDSQRGDEIQDWLDEHPEVTDFVILDDDSDMRGLRNRLVQTSWERGIQEKHVRMAVRMLTEGKAP